MATKIKIPISSIAPIVGLDHYDNFPKIVCELWRKYKRDDFNKIEKQKRNQGIDIATDSEARRLTRNDIKKGTNYYQQIKALNTQTHTSESLVEKQNKIIKQIEDNSTMNSLEKEDVKKQVLSISNKTHGVKNENNTLDLFCKETNLTIKVQQESLTYKFHSMNNIDWILTGRTDGLTTCNKLIEAKKRQKRLFMKLRDYEEIQIQTYLHIKNLDSGFLVESYSTNNNTKINIIPVERDNELIQNNILNKLVKFTIFFNDFMTNEEWQNELLLGDKNKNIFNTYYNEYLNQCDVTEVNHAIDNTSISN